MTIRDRTRLTACCNLYETLTASLGLPEGAVLYVRSVYLAKTNDSKNDDFLITGHIGFNSRVPGVAKDKKYFEIFHNILYLIEILID